MIHVTRRLTATINGYECTERHTLELYGRIFVYMHYVNESCITVNPSLTVDALCAMLARWYAAGERAPVIGPQTAPIVRSFVQSYFTDGNPGSLAALQDWLWDAVADERFNY